MAGRGRGFASTLAPSASWRCHSRVLIGPFGPAPESQIHQPPQSSSPASFLLALGQPRLQRRGKHVATNSGPQKQQSNISHPFLFYSTDNVHPDLGNARNGRGLDHRGTGGLGRGKRIFRLVLRIGWVVTNTQQTQPGDQRNNEPYLDIWISVRRPTCFCSSLVTTFLLLAFLCRHCPRLSVPLTVPASFVPCRSIFPAAGQHCLSRLRFIHLPLLDYQPLY